MKVRELLLELAEVLNRHASYGSWIDSNTGKIYPVEKMGGHAKFIISKLKEYGFPAHLANSEENLYVVGFKKGLVRITHLRPHSLTAEGMGEDIKSIVRILAASMAQQDLSSIHIDKVMNIVNALDNTDSRSFSLPEQRREAIQFINAG